MFKTKGKTLTKIKEMYAIGPAISILMEGYIEKDKLIEFVNVVNECCEVMPDDKVADWLLTPNSDLNMEMPIELIKDNVGMEKVFRLLYFIDIGEADL